MQHDCTSSVHDGDGPGIELQRTQLGRMVQTAIRSISQLQRDGEWDDSAAARLVEAGYALNRAAIALGEIDNAEQNRGGDATSVAPLNTRPTVGGRA